MRLALPPLALCRVWWTSQAEAGYLAPSGPLAVQVAELDRVTDVRGDGVGCSRCPAAGSARRAARRATYGAGTTQATRTREQGGGLADDGLLQRLPGQGRARLGRDAPPQAGRDSLDTGLPSAGSPLPAGPGPPGPRAVAEPVQLDAQPDQVIQRARVDIAGYHRREYRIKGDRLGCIPVEPRAAAIPAAARRRRPARGEPGPLAWLSTHPATRNCRPAASGRPVRY